jgi:hypothetical protein
MTTNRQHFIPKDDRHFTYYSSFWFIISSLREPTPDDRAWVPHKTGAANDDPESMELNSTFDVYVDMVRFIPDLASIIKVRLELHVHVWFSAFSLGLQITCNNVHLLVKSDQPKLVLKMS